MIGQTFAIMLDALRRLQAQKMFWVAMFLSAAVVVSFAVIELDDTGISLIFWHFNSDQFNTTQISAPEFYKATLFGGFGVNLWLANLAVLLALVSTAAIMPDLVSGGTIPLMLSKPISRARVFLTTYCSGLLFVALQVLVFTGGSFLVLGIRQAGWDPRMFWAIPIVVCVFSYLYCVCAVVGAITRSTLTALLVTFIFWGMLFVLHASDVQLLALINDNQDQQSRLDTRINALKTQHRKALNDAAAMLKALNTLTAASASGPARPAADPHALRAAAESMQANCRQIETRLNLAIAERAQLPQAQQSLRKAHDFIFKGKSLLPKIVETSQLTQWKVLGIEPGHKAQNRFQRYKQIKRHTAPPPGPDDENPPGQFDRVYENAEAV